MSRFSLIFLSVLGNILLSFRGYADVLQYPYSNIKVMPEYPFGYYYNRDQIERIFAQSDIKVVVEVGSWIGGGSTRHFGELLQQKKGTVYAIDTWLGSTTQQPGMEHYQPILERVYQQFLSNMIHWKLTNVVIPIRMKSIEASLALDVHPDLVYIDGEHTTDAVYQDLTTWYPFVKNHGILCGDDWGWSSVRAAVEAFARQNNLKIDAEGNFWLLCP